MKRIIIATIRIYQRTLSPDHGVFSSYTLAGCRYYPSCSEYMIRAIMHFGVWKGAGKGIARIVRCNPFSAGGVDDPITINKQSL